MGIDPDGTLYLDGYIWTPEGYLNTYELDSRFGVFLHGYIAACDGKSVTLDEIEWSDQENTERAAQLGLDANSFPNGYYIYDEKPGMTTDYPLADGCVFERIDWERVVPQKSDMNEFMEHIQTRQEDSEQCLYQLWIVNGEVRGVSECYQP